MSRINTLITRTMRERLFKLGIESWPGVSARVVHGGLIEVSWPPELTSKIVMAVHRATPARQVQQIRTHVLLQVRLFNAHKAWRESNAK